MVEFVTGVKITIEIDTNKWTHKEEFEDIDEAREWYHSILEAI